MSKSDYEVHVLYEGYSKCSDSGMTANCTCTLIKGSKNKIIVDTMTPWDSEKIKEGLAKHNLTCSDINWVVCTHGHSDHTGNNNLFLSAKHIVGFSISFKDLYEDAPFDAGDDYDIDEFVTIHPTPGHTLTDVTVMVETKNDGYVAVTGDLFERVEDLEDESIWMKLGGSEDPELQREGRERILQAADYIIPGHGPMFKVTDSMRESVKSVKKAIDSTLTIYKVKQALDGEYDDEDDDD